MEELVYVIVYLMLGRLPWMKEEVRLVCERERWERDGGVLEGSLR